MALIPKISFPIPANEKGKVFGSVDELLSLLSRESSGLFLVGSQGMWHGGIHITDTSAPWCALTGTNRSELEYVSKPYSGEQAVGCMADGEIVAYRVCEDYGFIEWRGDRLYFSTSFVLVKHYIQPGENASGGLTFYTLYMNLAPVSAYGQTDVDLRETAKGQSYYTSAEDVNAGKATGTLPVGSRVKLSAQVMTSARHHRQFCEVTVVNESGALKAGDKVWTVSDRGWLKPLSGEVKGPSWWKKCSLAHRAGSDGQQDYKTSTTLKCYLSSADVSAGKGSGKLAKDFPVTVDTGVPVFTRPTDKRVFSLVTLGKDMSPLKKGDRVWVVSDNDSLVAENAQSAGTAKYGEVVVPETPVAVSAGDSIGHLGFYELPEENGKRSRYQVHIECLSPDSNLPTFLSNPDKAGGDKPAYLRYAEGAELYMPDAQGKMVSTLRKSRAPGILTRTKVPGVDAEGKALSDNLSAAYYQVRPEGGWLSATDVEKVSQFDLASRGFITLDKAPESFDLIDGIHHPDNVVKGILEALHKAAKTETDGSRMLNQYNYERLLKQTDTNNDGHYSEQEYLQAVHNPSYRDHLYRIIVKHPSEWYYGKGDKYWKTYLDTLTKEASLLAWKNYTEAFIEKMAWMKAVPGMEAEPWHMHPVVFLDLIGAKSQVRITVDMLYKVFEGLTSPTKKEFFQQFADEINNNAEKYKLDTLQRVNHFFAQVREEMGGSASPVEGLNYSEEGLKTNFKYFRTHPDEAKKYSYKKYGGEIINRADETAIANRVYANRLGNGSVASGDGSKYCGRGGVHLTGKVNYEGFSAFYKTQWGDGVDFINNPSLIEKPVYCVRSAVYFWLRENLYSIADTGNAGAVVDKITAKVNLHTDSYAKRREHFENIMNKEIFLEAFQ